MSMSYTDLLDQYKNKFDQNYPFIQPANPGSDFREIEWLKIIIKKEKLQPELLRFMLTINEIFRFEIGNTQPEHRLSDNYIYTKRIEQDEDVGFDRIRTLFFYYRDMVNGNQAFWEGMGRVFFCKYLYQDDDFNLYNGLVNKDKYFIGLDSERCFWTLTEKYHYGPGLRPAKIKSVVNNNTPFTVNMCFTPEKQPIFVIPDKPRVFVGDMHHEDYESFPKMKYFYPCNWFPLAPELQNYTLRLSKDQRFLNEKHFSALKSLVTFIVKKLLVDLHMDNEKDRQDAHDFIAVQFSKMKEICKQSSTFKEYLKTNRVAAMQTILHEINLFFNNPAYRFDDKTTQNTALEFIQNEAIQQFAILLESCGIGFSAEEKITLSEFANKLNAGLRDTLTDIRDFYKNQLMDYHAAQVDTLVATLPSH